MAGTGGLAPGKFRPAASEATICAGFRARLGAQVLVAIELVERIAPERSGKHRYVVSHVDT